MTAALLRLYDPPECDEHGVPLDWDRCRTCEGVGTQALGVGESGPVFGPCPTCGGFGSLKKAALVALKAHVWKRGGPHPDLLTPMRCESCWHPMSDGTWEGPRRGARMTHPPEAVDRQRAEDFAHAERCLRAGEDPDTPTRGTFWSLCDEQCRHDGRVETASAWSEGRWTSGIYVGDVRTAGDMVRICKDPVRSAWRSIDVRTLGWAHDLRISKLSALCLRCWAERSK